MPPEHAYRTQTVLPARDDVVFLRGMDSRISVMRDWAPRTAVVVGQALDPSLVGVLSRMGFHPIVVSPSGASAMLRSLGPVSFFLLGPDVFRRRPWRGRG